MEMQSVNGRTRVVSAAPIQDLRYNQGVKFERASAVKIAGITFLLLGLFGFMFLMQYFQLFDTTIEFNNPAYLSKMLLADTSLIVGMYLGFYLLGGRGLALIIGGGFALLFLGSQISALPH